MKIFLLFIRKIINKKNTTFRFSKEKNIRLELLIAIDKWIITAAIIR